MKTFKEYLEIIQEGKITSNHLKQDPNYKDKKQNSEGFVYIVVGKKEQRGSLDKIVELLIQKNPKSVTIYDISSGEIAKYLKSEGITAYDIKGEEIGFKYPYVQLELRSPMISGRAEKKEVDDMGPEDYNS